MKNIGNILKNFICWCLLLQLVNLSVNPLYITARDKGVNAKNTFGKVNEVESVYELIATTVYDQEVPESEDEDIDNTFSGIDLFCSSKPIKKIQEFQVLVTHYPRYHHNTLRVYPEPLFPPPKAA